MLLAVVALCCGTPAAGHAQEPGSLDQADALMTQTTGIWRSGNLAEIGEMLDRALRIREYHLGPTHLAVAEVLGQLGRNAWNSGDYVRAEEAFRRALAIEERTAAASFSTARLLGDLGATLREQGRCDEAEPLVRRSVMLRSALVPPNDPWIAGGLDNLAQILLCQNRRLAALPLAEQALMIRREALGPEAQATRWSEALAAMLEPATRYFRIGAIVAGGGLIFLLASVAPTILLERFGDRRLLTILAATLALGGLLGVLVGSAMAGPIIVVEIFRDPGLLNVRRFGGGIASIATILSVGVYVMMLRAGRMAFRLPQKPLFPPVQENLALRADPQIRTAIWWGWATITAPGMALMVSGFLGVGFGLGAVFGWVGVPDHLASIAVAVSAFLFGFGAPLLWYFAMMPHWRLRALRTVANLPLLEQEMAAFGIAWSSSTAGGRLMRKLEWWTPTQRREATRLLAERALDPRCVPPLRPEDWQ